MEITVLTGILVALCGIGVGILSAMFGIGGGIVMVPLIHIVFGQPAAVSSGTSLFAILPTSIAGMAARLHDGTIRFRIGVVVGVAGACLSPLGAVAAKHLPGIYAMVLTGVFILYTAYNMFRRWWRTRPQAQPVSQAHVAARAAAGPSVAPSASPAASGSSARAGAPTAVAASRPAKAPLLDESARDARFYGGCVALGAIVGFLSGYLGLGGGFIIVPILQAAFGLTMKQSTGTSLVAVGILAVPSFVTHAILGDVAWLIGILLIVGSVVGARLGAQILRRVNDRALTGLFGVVLVLAGVIMVVREFVIGE